MKTPRIITAVSLSLSMLYASVSLGQENGWTRLFDGKDLNGWKQLNGKSEYKVSDSAIVGISVLNDTGSFLCTEASYDDFILELDFKIEPPLNSGIQIRSNVDPSYRNGRVFGYQFEIDPSARRWSGGIYDESRRGWIYPLTRNPAGQNAFKQGVWNHCRIEAIGDTMRTWVNGIMCSNLVDNLTHSGFIGLQIDGIGNNTSLAGKKVMWKNIRIMTTDLINNRQDPDPRVEEINYIPNTLTQTEIKNGWRLLWDGKSTKGWESAKGDKFPEKGWVIKDGVLTVLESGGNEAAFGGDIITDEKYSNFILEVDFNITKGANSGIKYFVDPGLNKKTGSAIGLEYQILDNANHPDAKMGVDGNRTLASLYDLIPAQNLSVPGSEVPFNGIGEWNRARIVVQGNHIEHWINNIKVVDYERGTQIFRALVAKSKYHVWPDFGEAPEGNILLQDHGNEVHFRSIKIKPL